jgi:hypothetical protein
MHLLSACGINCFNKNDIMFEDLLMKSITLCQSLNGVKKHTLERHKYEEYGDYDFMG